MCKKNSFGPDLIDADVSAIVSALAKQQSEVEEEAWEDSDSQQSDGNDNENKRRGGRIGKCLRKERKGVDNDLSSSEDNCNNDHATRYQMSKDLHDLSKMFIQTTMLPRPKSEVNLKGRQQTTDGEANANGGGDAEVEEGETSTQRDDRHRTKRCREDKHDNEHRHHHHHHHLPLSLSFHPIKTLQKTFHKSDILFPSPHSFASHTPPLPGTLAPVSSPRLLYNPHQHGHFHHHYQTPATSLKVSSGTGLTSHSSRSSPTHKSKSKLGKYDHPADTSLSTTTSVATTSYLRARSPSHGTIRQITAPTPPGGLPIYITSVLPTDDESISESTQTVETKDKRTKYAKVRAKSSGTMK